MARMSAATYHQCVTSHKQKRLQHFEQMEQVGTRAAIQSGARCPAPVPKQLWLHMPPTSYRLTPCCIDTHLIHNGLCDGLTSDPRRPSPPSLPALPQPTPTQEHAAIQMQQLQRGRASRRQLDARLEARKKVRAHSVLRALCCVRALYPPIHVTVYRSYPPISGYHAHL